MRVPSRVCVRWSSLFLSFVVASSSAKDLYIGFPVTGSTDERSRNRRPQASGIDCLSLWRQQRHALPSTRLDSTRLPQLVKAIAGDAFRGKNIL